MTTPLLLCVGYFVVVSAICYAGKLLGDRGHQRSGLALLEFGVALLKPAEGVAKITVFVLLFWCMEMFGGWEPPTPENIRKLDAETADL